MKTFGCQFKNEWWFQGMWAKRPGALASVGQTNTVKLWEWLWHAVITGHGSLTRWPALLSVLKNPLWAAISAISASSRLQGFPSSFCRISSLVRNQELHLLESSQVLLHGLCPFLAAWNALQEAAGREDTLIHFAWIRAKKQFSKTVQVIRSQLITKSRTEKNQ